MPVWGSAAKAQTLEPYAVFNEATGTLTFKCNNAKPSYAYPLNKDKNEPLWITNTRYAIKTVVFDASFTQARPTTCYHWFKGCEDLSYIQNIKNLNTENVKDMSGMFNFCEGLTSLDVSNFNTTNVEDMSDMFFGCEGLYSLDVSNFNTTNVKDMSRMFCSCKELYSLDLSNFNTTNVKYMISMFSNGGDLTWLDLSNFNTKNVTNMAMMFNHNPYLKTIYASNMFVTTKVQDSFNMFKGCTSLKGAIAYDESKVDHRYANYKYGYFTHKNASAINSPTTANNETTDYFNLQGIRTDNMHKGINIVRHGNKTTKVLVK